MEKPGHSVLLKGFRVRIFSFEIQVESLGFFRVEGKP